MNTYAQDDQPRASRWTLFLPLAIGAVLVVIYWFVWSWGAGVMREEIANWKTAQEGAGLTIEHGPMKVTGFPFVLRAELPDPYIANPAAGWAWQAEMLYADTPPLSPNRIVLSPEGDQQLNLTDDSGPNIWNLTAETFRISLAEAKTGLDVRGLRARPERRGDGDIAELEIGSVMANTLITENPENGRSGDLGRFALSARDIVFEKADGTPPLAFAEVDLSVVATAISTVMTRQGGESNVAAWQRGNGELVIEGLRLVVSDGRQAIPTQLRANGTLTLDNEHYPAGTVELTLKDHLALVSVLREQGLITQEESEQADNALRFLSQAMGEEIKAPLQLRNGKLRLGPVAIMDLDKVG